MSLRPIAVAAVLSVAACAGQPSTGILAPGSLPRTRAEQTNYLETSKYTDVVAFLDALKALNAPLAFGSIGRTTENRDIPYVIASRPLVRTAAEAKATGKPIVYVQGNIHAGEVEGKEALQALIRDLAFARGPNVLDSIVLVAVPIYNADGNERFLPQERARGSQNGPEMVGQRPNAQGLDLNRDYIKAEAPETRASLAMFNAWDPDVFVDLHTTNGSFHGYALTYSPSLHPSAPLGDFSRIFLNELRNRVRARDGYETFDYGNFNDGGGREVSTDSVHSGWYTYEHLPRYGTNYYGLRGKLSVLSEAYSHDPFERRVKATYSFTKQLLSLVAERAGEIRNLERMAEAELAGNARPQLALRSALPKEASAAPVIYEILERTGDTLRTQPGVPRGMRRTGRFLTRPMPVFDRFVPAVSRQMPALYLVNDTAALARLRLHGVRAEPMGASERMAGVERFAVDSMVKSARAFQGHSEVRLLGRWVPGDAPSGAGWHVVRTSQPLGRVAMYLLDPEADDGLHTWNLFDARLAQRSSPVLRVP